MSDLFVTGISGLVGRAVAAELEARRLGATVLLRGSTSDLSGGFRVIAGDLETPQTFAPALKGVRAVLHIAALTGAASEEDFRRVNVEGTRTLLAACAEEGIRRFVFVSSIAAGFDDLDRYPYGASKRDAEALVRDSGLDFVIVRPTVVLGPGSPILQRFAPLAQDRRNNWAEISGRYSQRGEVRWRVSERVAEPVTVRVRGADHLGNGFSASENPGG